ncbi:MAG: DUF2807 domain-containing protein, partial [Prevotellaceae bacterium]|nr:DUF2807 domain-containing protein [Prevotellaceae bacterium]
MKKLLLSLFFALGSLSAAYAAKVTVVTVERPLFGFTRIVNDCPYDIHFYESDDYMVRVVARQNDVNYIYTVLRDNELRLVTSPNHKFKGNPYVEIYCPPEMLLEYTGTGAGSFIAMTAINLLNTIFEITGAGNVHLGIVKAKNLDLRSHGSGNINLNRQSVIEKHTISQKGTGKVNFQANPPSPNAPVNGASRSSATRSRTSTSTSKPSTNSSTASKPSTNSSTTSKPSGTSTSKPSGTSTSKPSAGTSTSKPSAGSSSTSKPSTSTSSSGKTSTTGRSSSTTSRTISTSRKSSNSTRKTSPPTIKTSSTSRTTTSSGSKSTSSS